MLQFVKCFHYLNLDPAMTIQLPPLAPVGNPHGEIDLK